MAGAPIDVERILAGDRRALARAATAVESGRAHALLSALRLHAGRALVAGITGAPGAGKSTLIDQLIQAFRAESKTVAVIAVDPSSPFSGGAILGDRIRMMRHHDDAGVFVRSMSSRGELGGLAQTTSNMATLLDAAGFDVVLIETVGVGQGEVDVAKLPGLTVVVLVPGMGDDVQAIKSGLMEIADIFVINKSDRPGAAQLEIELRHSDFNAPIVKTVASTGDGVAALIEAMRETKTHHRIVTPENVAIDHLGIAVRSIEQALSFYRDQLGLPVASRETVAAEKVHVAMLPASESRIELLEAASPDSTIAKFIDKRGEGLHHVALKVPDLAAAVARLEAAGSRILNEPRQGAGGHLYVFVHPASTGGVLLELIQA